MIFNVGPLILSAVFCFLLSSSSSGNSWPFPSASASTLKTEDLKQIAIIGAGPAGSATAYYLQKFANSSGVNVQITLFERSSYVGGRSTTVSAYNDASKPVELGASLFVEVNKILKDAADHFKLDSESLGGGDEPETLGIWNGERFVFTQKDGGWQWWDTTKLFWKYGLAPIRTQNLMKATVGKFLKLYEAPFFPFRSLSSRAQDLDLIAVTGVTGEQYLTANKIGPPFTTDIIQASTRVNYGQNLGIIHGLETMVCMATSGAMSIQGGNWKIFSGMVKASGALLRQNTTITGIKKQKGKFTVSAASSQSLLSLNDQSFDTVVLAAPLQFSNIDIQEGLVKHLPDKIPYVKLHVTLFTSPFKINGSYFDLKPGANIPTTILTTLGPEENSSNRTNVVGKSGFFSVSTLRSTINPRTAQKEYIYKIFSPKAVTADFLSGLLGIPVPNDVKSLVESPTAEISWYYPHVWDAYPFEYPRVTFEDPELARGFYYTSGMESFISTMETSALMGMNVAQLIVDDITELNTETPITGKLKMQQLVEEL